jgi:hypothetical protein
MNPDNDTGQSSDDLELHAMLLETLGRFKSDDGVDDVETKQFPIVRLCELHMGIIDIIDRLPSHSFSTRKEYWLFVQVVETLVRFAKEIEPVLRDAVLKGGWDNPNLIEHCEFIVNGANQCGRFRVSQELPEWVR